ncbi:PLAC8 family-domain-containing protein, partial [Penicillium chrysogenum]
FAPCCLYSKTQSRLKDAELRNYGYCNHEVLVLSPELCYLFSFLCCVGLHWVLLAKKRNNMRKQFDIAGSASGDYMESCCCSCCVLAQLDKEVEHQSITEFGYQLTPAMSYK